MQSGELGGPKDQLQWLRQRAGHYLVNQRSCYGCLGIW